jgi:riboflavin kinase / FMN adenylyltransferase
MRIYHDLSEVSLDKNTVITLGTFDGIHLGHRKIIDEVVKKATKFGGRSFLITFFPHPRKVVSSGNQVKLLNTPDEKAEMIEKLGIENLLIINFTKEFSQLSPQKFIEKYIVQSIGAKEVVIGYDHHFGKARGGDIDSLMEQAKVFGFDVTVIPAFNMDGVSISSSKIRKAVSDGDINLANKYLGRYYSFRGKVIHGDKRGRELGFPTANLKVDNNDKLLPAIGIYVVELFVNDKQQFGLLSIGKRPTFYDSGEIVPEVYIYDFEEDIYDKQITINVVERLRGEEKFSSVNELIDQMNKDKKNGLEVLNKLK